MSKINLENKLKEFKMNLWDHSVDPFQVEFDNRRPLNKEELDFLFKITKLVKNITEDSNLIKKIYEAINGKEGNLVLLLQVCGLTRNKIISDLKAVRSSSKSLKIPSDYKGLIRNETTWEIAGQYLIGRLRKIFSHVPLENNGQIMEALNQVTWPGFMRQERAKRSGHQAEQVLAKLLHECGIPFEPVEKLTNPLCRDAQIYNVSFDLVVPNTRTPRVCVKSTVHTSNIGQFGESKDALEIGEALEMIDKKFKFKQRPKLIAFIDGVGFNSNTAGLKELLEKSDEFFQFNSIWKAVIICSHAMKIPLKIKLPEEAIKVQKEFLRRYNFLNNVYAEKDKVEAIRLIKAGDGSIIVSA